jgi:hypothetical protein
MERGTQKMSTILVSVGNETRTFRSIAEMPPSLRKKLIETTSGRTAGTLLIADERGRQEILRTMQGHTSSLESRLLASLARQYSGGPKTRWFSWRHVAEIGLVAGIGLCLWLLAAWR